MVCVCFQGFYENSNSNENVMTKKHQSEMSEILPQKKKLGKYNPKINLKKFNV